MDEEKAEDGKAEEAVEVEEEDEEEEEENEEEGAAGADAGGGGAEACMLIRDSFTEYARRSRTDSF